MNEEYIHNIEYHNDYFVLLEHGYPAIEGNIQNEVISLILKGPSEEKIMKISENFSAAHTKKDYINKWILDRLWIIKELLNKESLDKLNKLKEKYGEPQHPKYAFFISEGFWVHDESPLSIKEILSYAPKQLWEYIKSFTPNEFGSITHDEISHKGFAKNIAEAFFLKPKLFTEIISEFISLPHPYISGILSFGREKIKDKKDIPWDEMLIILRGVKTLSQEIETKEESEKYFEQRIQAMWFVESILQNKLPLPKYVFDEIFEILFVFLNDFDLDEERDFPPDGHFTHNDPISLSINSIRPIALSSLIRMISIENKAEVGDERLKIFFNKIEEKLDRKKEKSWAVHSVFGEWISLFYILDKKWFLNKLDSIFTIQKEEEIYFLAAWYSFIIHNNPNQKVINILRSKFRYAIKLYGVGKKLDTYLQWDSRFITFLLLDYFWNNYKITETNEENLINYFLRTSDFEGRGKVILGLSNLIESMKEFELKENW